MRFDSNLFIEFKWSIKASSKYTKYEFNVDLILFDDDGRYRSIWHRQPILHRGGNWQKVCLVKLGESFCDVPMSLDPRWTFKLAS